MEQSAIFGPFLATMFLTVAVWIFMFVKRIRFLTAAGIDSKDLTTPDALAKLTPPDVSNPSDNLKNLFEIPVLFYALCLLLFVTEQVDGVNLAAAWTFALFRVLHSAVHCTFNHVMLRFYLYAISTLAVFFLLGRALLHQLGG